ncbi:SGNH/GDSL hydrolase family protein [Chitinophaga sancti]|uniref:SGNH/GDSL hydrolase family protein n=1 Tax=Chitinophaga sancti TaxID=1004 RepID=A0A1K1LY52_9BACT|nr:SGNH/GDSL hydrolase family protein [Chitinophaga sancti]WQD64757.1 SGNH/GDSL hydrolase family protein [Chitinophaga sancti]WQG89621.1 SGNH/GDSL hydrolase family protein [Chitinophaga sancti]SFW15778.1 hypothetical protein SAMN05661012_00313 [Chitinophaga sancti]
MATAIELFKAAVKSSIGDKIAEGSIVNADIAQRFYDAADLILSQVAFGSLAFKGDAGPTTNPGAVAGGRMWITSTAGTYTNFGGLVVNANEAAFLVDNGTAYTKVTIPLDLTSYLQASSIVSKGIIGKNLFNKADYINGQYISVSNGALSSAANTAVSKAISLPTGATQLSFSGFTAVASKYYRWLDASSAILSFAALPATSGTLTIPTNAKYFQTTIRWTSDADLSGLNTIQIEIGSAPTVYEAYSSTDTIGTILTKAVYAGILDSNTQVLGTPIGNSPIPKNYADATYAMPGYSNMVGNNLFNKAAVVEGKYISVSNFDIQTATGWTHSPFIKTTPGETYTISGLVTFTSKAIQFADISKTKLTTNPGTKILSQPFTFTAPAGCEYIVFTVKDSVNTTSVYDSAMINIGSSALAYEAYTVTPVANQINSRDILAKYLDTNATIAGKQIVTKDMLSTTAKSITLSSADKLLIFGCSYTESAYAIKNKSWVNKLANYLDWTVYNFGESGNRIIDELNRFRNNTSRFGVSPQAINGSLIWIGNIGNETLWGYDSDLYIKQMRSFIEFAKANGAQLVLSTDHITTGKPWIESLIADIAKEYDCFFIPAGAYGDKILRINVPAGFWGASHPGTRVNAYQFVNQLYYFNQIRRPRQSIKLFRKRSAFAPSTINDLNFELNTERVKKWIELNSGENSLNEVDNSYQKMDQLDQTYTRVDNTNEYGTLISKSAVSFADYMLVSAVIDVIRPTKIEIKIATTAAPSWYVKDLRSNTTWGDSSKYQAAFNLDKATYDATALTVGDTYSAPSILISGSPATLTYTGKTYDPRFGYLLIFTFPTTATSGSYAGGSLTKISGSGPASITFDHFDSNINYSYSFLSQLNKPDGAFVSLTASTDGGYKVITLEGIDLQKYLEYDKFHLVGYLAGGFSITDLIINVTGGTDKRDFPRTISLPGTGSEKMYTTAVDAIGSGWTLNGAAVIEQMPTGYKDYPTIAGGSGGSHISLKYDTEDMPGTMRASIAIDNSANGYRKLVVKVINRLFPKIYLPAGSETAFTTTVREITTDSYDFGTICLSLNSNTGYGNTTLRRPTDIGWNLAIFEIPVPPFAGDIDLILHRDPADIIDKTNYKNHTWPLHVCYVSAQLV